MLREYLCSIFFTLGYKPVNSADETTRSNFFCSARSLDLLLSCMMGFNGGYVCDTDNQVNYVCFAWGIILGKRMYVRGQHVSLLTMCVALPALPDLDEKKVGIQDVEHDCKQGCCRRNGYCPSGACGQRLCLGYRGPVLVGVV